MEFSRWAKVTNVGSGTIEQLDDAVRRATREYLTSPPGALLHCVGCRPRSEPLSLAFNLCCLPGNFLLVLSGVSL